MSLRRTLSSASTLVGALLFVIVGNALITGSGLQSPVALLRDITKHGLWRSANNAYSQRAANFYEFLNREIPSNTRVLIPSRSNGPEALTNTGTAQFLLYPREVINCTPNYLECAKGFINTGTAIVLTNLDGFERDAQLTEYIRPFDSEWGLLLNDSKPGSTVQEDFSGLGEVAFAFVRAFLYFALLAAPWTYFSLHTNPSFGFAMHAAIGFGAGIGWQSLTLALLMIAGVTLSGALVFMMAALPWGTSLLLHPFWSRKRPFEVKLRMNYWVISFFLVVLSASLIFSVARGYKVVDEITLWGAKGYGIVAAGLQKGATEWGTLTTRYPLNLPLTISGSLLLFGDRLPEAKLVFPMFSAAFIALVYELVKSKSNSTIALLAGAIIFTTPTVFFHSTIAYANLPLAFYLLAGTILLNYEVPPGKSTNTRTAVKTWGVVMFILAAWTRPEGLLLVWAATLINLLMNRRIVRDKSPNFWILLIPLAIYSVFWAISSRIIYTRPDFTSGAYGNVLGAMFSGDFHISELVYIIRSQFMELFSPSEWGLSSFLLAVLIIASAFTKRNSGSSRPYFLTGIITLILVVAIYYAFSFLNRPQDISWWVNTGLSRMTMPGILLIMVGAFTEFAARFSTKTLKAER